MQDAFPSAQVQGFGGTVQVPSFETPCAVVSTQVGSRKSLGEVIPDPRGASEADFLGTDVRQGQSLTVWVDGVPRVAVVGSGDRGFLSRRAY